MLGLITDYGYKDVYAGILRIVAKEICPKVEVVDVTHGVTPFSILEGAVTTLVTLPHMPKGSTLVVVVDPGVGTEREAVVAQIGEWNVVAPNNGVLWLAAKEYGVKKVIRIEKKLSRYQSSTFHGRDIFVPAGAALECGTKLEDFGSPTSLVPLNMKLIREHNGNALKATVLYVDQFGNIMTWFKGQPFEYGKEVLINGKYRAKVVNSFAELSPGELGVYVNSFGYLEIAKYLGNAAKEIGVAEGDVIEVIA